MNLALIEFWYRRVLSFLAIIDRLAGDDTMIAAVNEAIRRAVYEAQGYIVDVTETQECVAVELDQAS